IAIPTAQQTRDIVIGGSEYQGNGISAGGALFLTYDNTSPNNFIIHGATFGYAYDKMGAYSHPLKGVNGFGTDGFIVVAPGTSTGAPSAWPLKALAKRYETSPTVPSQNSPFPTFTLGIQGCAGNPAQNPNIIPQLQLAYQQNNPLNPNETTVVATIYYGALNATYACFVGNPLANGPITYNQWGCQWDSDITNPAPWVNSSSGTVFLSTNSSGQSQPTSLGTYTIGSMGGQWVVQCMELEQNASAITPGATQNSQITNSVHVQL
ncbi:MAG: hypothetical protein D6808_07105, partial [Candidatus Dadabacteria bacterium]